MRRREFIAGTGLVAASALGGCLGDESPPPRKSSVFQTIEAQGGRVAIDLEGSTWVKSRYDSDGQNDLADPGEVGGIAPVGGAQAKGKGGGGGRGATGRADGGYRSAPKTSHGRAWWHGGGYADDWYEDHQDDISKYGVTVATVGVAYLGKSYAVEDDMPGAGPVPWDFRDSDPDDGTAYPIESDGWYRVGAELTGPDGHDFGWEVVDLKIDAEISSDGYEVEKQWKVSPRI